MLFNLFVLQGGVKVVLTGFHNILSQSDACYKGESMYSVYLEAVYTGKLNVLLDGNGVMEDRVSKCNFLKIQPFSLSCKPQDRTFARVWPKQYGVFHYCKLSLLDNVYTFLQRNVDLLHQ